MNNGFTPIGLEAYVALHLHSNPGVDRTDLVERLQYALAAAKRGELCRCGGPIWVIGSAEVGLSCFTCITGELHPNDDYELEIDAPENANAERGLCSGRRV
jgi:hypothetical protein